MKEADSSCKLWSSLISSIKASDEKDGEKGLLKAELEGIFGKPKPNVVSVTWSSAQYNAMK